MPSSAEPLLITLLDRGLMKLPSSLDTLYMQGPLKMTVVGFQDNLPQLIQSESIRMFNPASADTLLSSCSTCIALEIDRMYDGLQLPSPTKGTNERTENQIIHAYDMNVEERRHSNSSLCINHEVSRPITFMTIFSQKQLFCAGDDCYYIQAKLRSGILSIFIDRLNLA